MWEIKLQYGAKICIMNKKLLKYIDYIVKEIEPPYFKNIVELYDVLEYKNHIIKKIIKEAMVIQRNIVYDIEGRVLYNENKNIYTPDITWERYQYDSQGNRIYYGDSSGFWYKKVFDEEGNEIYFENSAGLVEIIEDEKNLLLSYIISIL